MILFPNAKINLGLEVLRRRPDGYHDICTVMVPTRWEDVLELTPDATTSLHVTGRAVDCPPEKNLVMKAYRLMERTVPGLPPTRIGLHKIIPDGAGLGGGSADAAFSLRGLNELYSLGLTDVELAAMAGQLGSDCPFFIYNRPMLCTGTGGDMAPVELPQLAGLDIVMVKPAESVSTAQAYSAVTPREPATPLMERLALPVELWQGSVVNDFEPSVIPQLPVVGRIKEQLLHQDAVYAAMSGSGSTVFGLFPAGQIDDTMLRDAFPEHCHFVSRAGE